jgi:hypothetical protein
VRRLIAVLALTGCAQAGMPPGGPPDKNPPRLVRVTPDTNALNVRGDAISFQFDEVVSERPRGAPGLAELFIVSPSTGQSRVSWKRSRVDITPHGGLQPNTTYRVRMLPGMVDLDGNADSTGVTVVFSTGPTIASGQIAGRAYDWVAARAAPRAIVEAITLPDSARFGTEADSSGAYVLTNMPPGQFLLRGFVDLNRNSVLDERELFDTVTVTLVDSLRRDLLAAVRDSLGAGIASADVRDSITLRLALDRPLDTLFVPTPEMFRIQTADSAVVPFASVVTQADVDRLIADSIRTKAVQDSVRRAFIADSARAADSAKAAVATGPRAPTAAPPPPRPTGRRPGATNRPTLPPPRDTSNRIIPKPAGRIPVTAVYVKFSQPLTPSTSYRVTATGLRSITGATRTSSRVFTTPRVAARPDTGKARPDTGRTSRE